MYGRASLTHCTDTEGAHEPLPTHSNSCRLESQLTLRWSATPITLALPLLRFQLTNLSGRLEERTSQHGRRANLFCVTLSTQPEPYARGTSAHETLSRMQRLSSREVPKEIGLA